MSIILHDCRPLTPVERLREYLQRVDPTTPEHRGRVIRGVRLQARYRNAGAHIGSVIPADADGRLMTYDDLSQGF